MTGSRVKTRFAPSPTGHLHVGNARTALLSALMARRYRGRFLLRIEDTDADRSRPEYVDSLIADLRWLGIGWDEGPDGGSSDYFQSNRSHIYGEYFETLTDRCLAYPCFCTEEELEQDRTRQRAVGHAPRYSRRCRGLSLDQRRARLNAGMPSALRFAVDDTKTVEFDDLVRGPQVFEAKDIGDFVIRRSDGTPAFFFSNAVDDALMGVTHVLRGEDHLTNTPRQILLLGTLALPAPRYGHLGLVVDSSGTPLSKRRGDLSLQALRERGYLSEAVVNYLARLGCSGIDQALRDFDSLAAVFDDQALTHGPAQYDESQLRYWQRQALQHVAPQRLWDWFGDEVRVLVPESLRETFVAAVRGNVLEPREALFWARMLFTEDWPISQDAYAAIETAGSGFFCLAADAARGSGGNFDQFREVLARSTGLRGRALFAPLRAALTGVLHGPEMVHLVPLLTAARLEARLSKWCKI